MLYRINDEFEGRLEAMRSNWSPKELAIERYLVTREDEIYSMQESVFGEPLLIVRNQVKTKAGKRADILALDRAGNGVIIELKKDEGRLGIETQAMQYLSDFSKHRGVNFINNFSENPEYFKDVVSRFLGGKVDIETINSRSRVILIARSFDETVFSLGEWLCSKDVAFRCISYFPVQVGDERFLSFSIAFDRAPESLYSLIFDSPVREPGYFWHNIAKADNAWWKSLVSLGQIPACFDDLPGDQGEKLLRKYIPGDIVVAYAKGFGAVGWAVVDDVGSYRLVPEGGAGDTLCGKCRHRLAVKWKAVASDLSFGLPADEIRQQFGIYHPISTSVSMNPLYGKRLVDRLTAQFSARDV